MSLPNWLGFNVLDGRHEYCVKIPVVHLVVSSPEQRTQALKDFVSCDCEMFQMQGWCKHVVAAMYKIESVFNLKRVNFKEKTQEFKGALDNIFNVENAKNEQKWILDFEEFLKNEESDLDGMLLKSLENSSLQAFKDFNSKVILQFDDILKENFKTWNGNKRAFKMFSFDRFFLIGAENWWNFWLSNLKNFEPSFYPKIIAYLFAFKLNYPELFLSLGVDLPNLIKNLEIENKNLIITEFQEYFKNSEEEVFDLAIAIEVEDFVLENLEYYNPNQLILILKNLPDLRESAEMVLARHVKVWVDFIKVGEYKELISVIKAWRAEVGESQFLDSVVEYILQNHTGKRSLIKAIKN